MKKYNVFIVFGFVLLLMPPLAWSSDPLNAPENTLAIVASLDQAGLTTLDDAALADIRGQASAEYVLVKMLGINTFDWGRGVMWTWNPLGYRYGYYGGPGWSNFDVTPVDAMDTLFKRHDSNGDDTALLAGLMGLKSTGSHSFWGEIYDSHPDGAPDSVNVFVVSFFGSGGTFRRYQWWLPMPYSEYSRREAVLGMTALIWGRSLFNVNGM